MIIHVVATPNVSFVFSVPKKIVFRAITKIQRLSSTEDLKSHLFFDSQIGDDGITLMEKAIKAFKGSHTIIQAHLQVTEIPEAVKIIISSVRVPVTPSENMH